MAERVEGCRAEAESLAALALLVPDEPEFAALAARARAVADRADLGSVDSERRLDEIGVALRRALLARGHRYADPHFRSPAIGPDRPLPSGDGVGFIYERGGLATGLEARLAAHAPAPAGWRVDHVVFNSGMAAISCALQCYRSITRPTAAEPLRVGSWAAYYETDILFGILRSESMTVEKVADPAAAAASGGFGMLYLEPVRYDWDLTPMGVDAFARAWHGRPAGGPRAILVDSTLSSVSWPTDTFLAAVADERPLLVVELRSGLKLDQQGMELANTGVASVYSRHESRDVPPAQLFGQYLRMARSVNGVGLSMDALAVLDHAFAFDAAWTRDYAGRVFRNNRLLAAAAAGQGGLFSRVGHPSLSATGTLRDAPFVMFQLAEDSAENHAFLLGLVREEVTRQGLPMTWGSSFGFRAHRWETIFPKDRRRGVFKVAMGARSGPSGEAAVDLLHRLARYPDFDALRRDHPRVRPVDMKAVTSGTE